MLGATSLTRSTWQRDLVEEEAPSLGGSPSLPSIPEEWNVEACGQCGGGVPAAFLVFKCLMMTELFLGTALL